MVQPDPNNEATFARIRINSTLRAAKRPETDILRAVEEYGYCREATFAIKLALEEALINAVKHGNQHDESKGVTVRYAVSADRTVIIIRDEGAGFRVNNIPDPTLPERLMLPTGRGIMLMRAYMDEVRYRDDGREVYLMKRNANKKGA